MDFTLPDDLVRLLADLDDFIDREIVPLQEQDDNIRFFDHRREYTGGSACTTTCRTSPRWWATSRSSTCCWSTGRPSSGRSSSSRR